MDQTKIFIPFFGLMLLTILVWCYMYYLRLSFIFRKKIDTQALAMQYHMLDTIPDKQNYSSENLINLFELPVLFYTVCLFLYVANQVDEFNLILAYGFLIFRIIHSLIHCTYNRVVHRFYAYVVSAIILWVMIIRAFITVL